MRYLHKAGPASAGIAFGSSHHCAALVVGILFTLLGQVEAAKTITAANPSLAAVSTAIASAVDGDTVIVPAGTGTDWTTTLTITKGISLIGSTTTDSVAGTANDQTIILDNIVRVGGLGAIIILHPGAGKTCRLSGFTFKPGTPTESSGFGAVRILGPQATCFRVDHCHFTTMHQAQMICTTTSVYGVVDHNVFEFTSGNWESFKVLAGDWNNNSDNLGDGSWADFPWYGTEKFVFFEDNYLLNTTGNELNGGSDSDTGGRSVFRHNHYYDVQIQNHGAESRVRGERCKEVYNNDFHYSYVHGFMGSRSGGTIVHDNTFDGVLPSPQGVNLQPYRLFQTFPGPFGGSSGDNAWDVNDTEPDHSPRLYASGTATGGAGNGSTVIDTTKTWTVNQWAGFSVKRVSDSTIGTITSNTSNALTIYNRSGKAFIAGDAYQIHKVLVSLDQPGRGKGDLVVGYYATAAWPNEVLEPCYSWNNIYTPSGAHINFTIGAGVPPNLLQSGRDYYNNTPMPGYTPYIYPHPLVTGGAVAAPPAPVNLRVTSGP